MKVNWFLVCLLGFSVLRPEVATSGEIYRYQDESGAFYYTDDSNAVPEDKLPQVDSFDAITTEPENPSFDADTGTRAPDLPPAGKTVSEGDFSNETTGGNESEIAEQLEAEAKRLDQMHRDLQAEKAELYSQSGMEMTRRQLNAYEQQVMELNARIEQHAQQQADFEKRVAQYNARHKKEKEVHSDSQ